MSLIGRIFGSEKASESLVKTGLKMIDDAFYTDAERASDHMKERIQVAKSVQQWMESSGGPNLARRVIAMGIFGMWAFLWASSVIVHIATIFVGDPVLREVMDTVSTDARDYAVEINAEMILVLGYYFAAPQIDKFAAPLVAKLSKK